MTRLLNLPKVSPAFLQVVESAYPVVNPDGSPRIHHCTKCGLVMSSHMQIAKHHIACYGMGATADVTPAPTDVTPVEGVDKLQGTPPKVAILYKLYRLMKPYDCLTICVPYLGCSLVIPFKTIYWFHPL